MSDLDMPVLVPLVISTKEGLSVWRKIVIWMTQSRKFKLHKDWVFIIKCDLNGVTENRTIVIPEGFIFDGASIPRILWPLLNPYGILLIPGLVHDYAYKYGFLCISHGDSGILHSLDRIYWDKLFYEIAVFVNGMRFLNKLAYWGVRLGGWIAWNNHRKRDNI